MNGRGVGTLAGLGAAVVLLLAILALRFATGALSVVEVVADAILLVLPGALGSAVIDALQQAAKPLLYIGVCAGVLAVGGLLGRAYAARPGWQSSVALAIGAWLLFGLGVYTLVGGGLFGSRLQAGATWHALSLLALFSLYGVVLWALYRFLATRLDAPRSMSRREFVRGLGVVGVAAIGTAVAWRFVPRAQPGQPLVAGSSPSGNAAPFDVAGVAAEVTSNDDFYTVSKNMFDPIVEAGPWKLRIDGLVERPLELTYDQLRALPAAEGFYTLLCISNEVGGDLMGNAWWKGVKLRQLLDQAGVQPAARDAVFTAADDYKDSIVLERAMHPDTLLAYEMNGEPLPREHGFPARLLIPDIYGMKNVKWLSGINLAAEDVKGFWQVRGWDDSAHYQVMSRIDAPAPLASVRGHSLVAGGVAYAGERGIVQVEVSGDKGASWTAAQVRSQLSPYTWQLWRADLRLTPETRELWVRATDGRGTLQTQSLAEPYPAGSTGWHSVRVSVEG